MSDKLLEEVEEKWHLLPWWVKIKIVLLITAATWESNLAFWWIGI